MLPLKTPNHKGHVSQEETGKYPYSGYGIIIYTVQMLDTIGRNISISLNIHRSLIQPCKALFTMTFPNKAFPLANLLRKGKRKTLKRK